MRLVACLSDLLAVVGTPTRRPETAPSLDDYAGWISHR